MICAELRFKLPLVPHSWEVRSEGAVWHPTYYKDTDCLENLANIITTERNLYCSGISPFTISLRHNVDVWRITFSPICVEQCADQYVEWLTDSVERTYVAFRE